MFERVFDMKIEFNKDNTEKRIPKTFKIEPSLYKKASKLLKENDIYISCWIRDQISIFVKGKEIKNG